MKAIEKDRTHRYESASAFAADVQHYLNNEPIEARMPSAIYLSEFDAAIAPQYQRSTNVQLVRVHLLSDASAYAAERKAIVDQLDTDSSFVGLFALYALCRIGEPDEVRTLAREFAARIKKVPYSDPTLFGNVACIEALADGDEEALLEEASDSSLAKSQAYFTIGMLRLLSGNRPGALASFESSVETNAVGTYGYELARAYKARMTLTIRKSVLVSRQIVAFCGCGCLLHWLRQVFGKKHSSGERIGYCTLCFPVQERCRQKFVVQIGKLILNGVCIEPSWKVDERFVGRYTRAVANEIRDTIGKRVAFCCVTTRCIWPRTCAERWIT